MLQLAFIRSIEAVYCFLPLVVKVLFIGQVGAAPALRLAGCRWTLQPQCP